MLQKPLPRGLRPLTFPGPMAGAATRNLLDLALRHCSPVHASTSTTTQSGHSDVRSALQTMPDGSLAGKEELLARTQPAADTQE